MFSYIGAMGHIAKLAPCLAVFYPPGSSLLDLHVLHATSAGKNQAVWKNDKCLGLVWRLDAHCTVPVQRVDKQILEMGEYVGRSCMHRPNSSSIYISLIGNMSRRA